MNRFDSSAWLRCATPGCFAGTYADPRHIPNLTATGAWHCPECANHPANREASA